MEKISETTKEKKFKILTILRKKLNGVCDTSSYTCPSNMGKRFGFNTGFFSTSISEPSIWCCYDCYSQFLGDNINTCPCDTVQMGFVEKDEIFLRLDELIEEYRE